MSEPLVPEVPANGGESCWNGCPGAEERVQITITIGAKKKGLGSEVLHGKTKRVKLDGYIIVASELSNRYKVFDYVWRD
jgi:hypothetical protein